VLSRARIVIDGMIQGVGSRYSVRALARTYNLLGYVKNLDDGTVEIICEGERGDIEQFINVMKTVKEPAKVEKVDVSFEEAKKEFKTFRIVTGELAEEIVEGFSTGAAYFNILIGKQDQTIAEIRGLREELGFS